jgi:hypothetical protein
LLTSLLRHKWPGMSNASFSGALPRRHFENLLPRFALGRLARPHLD